MGFWVGNWLHDPPSKEYDSTGKRAIIKHLCFGPVETQTWYESVDGQYYCELHIIDGLQARDVFLDRISKAKMLEAIITERGRDFRRAEVAETDLNQTKRNQIDFIQPDPSTYPPAPSGRQMGIDRCEVREEVEEVKENIEYEHLWQELLSLMEQSGYEVKQQRGAISFRAPGQERFTRLRSSTLGKGYSQKDIEAALSSSQRGTGQPSQRVNLIIDIQSRLQGKRPGYERWAKVFNLKQMAAALAFLQENDLMEYGQLEKKAAEATERFHTLSGQIKSAEAALQTNRVKAATVQYAGTRPVGNRCLFRPFLSQLLRNPVYTQADLELHEFFKSQGAAVVNDAADFAETNGCYLYQGRDVKEGKSSSGGLAVLEHELELGQNHVPISTSGSPVLDNFPAGQVEHLTQGIVVGAGSAM